MAMTLSGLRMTVGAVTIRLEPWAATAREKLVAEWLELEERALEANAFLSPRFVLPAVRHLVASQRAPWLLTVRQEAGLVGRPLLLLGLVRPCAPSRSYPLPHLACWRSPHSYLDGLLVDREQAEAALAGLFAFLASSRHPWCGLRFHEKPRDEVFERVLARCALDCGRLGWDSLGQSLRARLSPQVLSDGTPPWSGRDEREFRRLWRRLGERGELSWRIVAGSSVGPQQVEDFLRLEDQGWKHDQGQSLRARPGHEAFFREMVEGFRRAGRVFFCELRLDARAIASASYLVSADAGFAFKIGWDVRYAKYAPGILNEVEFVRQVGRWLPQLRYIDSGAQPGSFVERLWPQRTALEDGVLVAGRTALALLPALRAARRLWRTAVHSQAGTGR